MKKDKLYKVNQRNLPLFMPRENLFSGLQDGSNRMENGRGLDLMGQAAMTPINPVIKNAPSTTVKPTFGQKANAFMGTPTGQAVGGAVAGTLGSAVGNMGYDLLSGGLKSGAGSAIRDIGGTIGEGIGSVNPALGAAVSVASGIIGGGVNALFGSAVNEKKLNAAKEGTAAYNNFTSNAGSFDNIQGPQAQAAVENAYRGGVFTKGSAARKNKALKEARIDARQQAFRSVDNNVDNLADDQMNDNLANFAAFGGPLDMGSHAGAMEYGFMSDYLTTKRKQAENKNIMTNVFMSTPKDLFAFGGDMQSNGADFPTRLSHINAGRSHEENPYDGVQMGVDENGVPNLVEEGETVYNDYVFSNRILADAETKKALHLPQKQKVTYADISKKLEKEIAERPNDPISKATFKTQMLALQEHQERQKKEMEAAKAQAMFASLSPEEQAALMQQKVQQDALAQEAVAAQQGAQEPSPEEVAMAQQQEAAVPSEEEVLAQQQTMADGSQPALGATPQVHACGGHLYKKGGGLLKALNLHTLSDFKKWLTDNKVSMEGIDFDKYDDLDKMPIDTLFKNDSFQEALKKVSPTLSHALSKGYDFGEFVAPKDKVTFGNITKGNWKATDGSGWIGSDDEAFLEATKGMDEDAVKKLSTQELATLMKATDAYKKGTQWLQTPEHALLYLNTIINDSDTPQDAKNYALKFVKDGNWKDGFNYDYTTVFGKDGKGVRETDPGTFWHLPKEATMSNVAKNFVRTPDGNIEAIIGDVPQDWKLSDTYSWVSPKDNSNNTYNYYSMPEKAKPATSTETEEEESGITPVIPKDYLRYAGLFGPLAGLTMQSVGLGKPDYTKLDAAVSGAGNVALAGRENLGNYLTYRPMDIWFEQSKMDANARATDRAITNDAAPVGTKMAGLLASGYNNLLADGELYRKALEYNDAKQQQVAEFNRKTDEFNADTYNRQSQFNASAKNEALGRAASAKLQAAQTKLNNDAEWYNGIYGNANQLFKGLSDLGKEKTATGWRNALATAGAYGVLDEDALIAAGMAKRKKVVSADGGSIKKRKKRRGMTF